MNITLREIVKEWLLTNWAIIKVEGDTIWPTMEYIARFATDDVKFENRYMDGRVAVIKGDHVEFVYQEDHKDHYKIIAADPRFFEKLEESLTHALFRHTNWYQAKNKEHWTFDARKAQ